MASARQTGLVKVGSKTKRGFLRNHWVVWLCSKPIRYYNVMLCFSDFLKFFGLNLIKGYNEICTTLLISAHYGKYFTSYITEPERSSGWLTCSVIWDVEACFHFNVSSDDQGSHPDDISVSVMPKSIIHGVVITIELIEAYWRRMVSGICVNSGSDNNSLNIRWQTTTENR